MGLPCDKTAAVGITFDDSYFTDSLSERNLDLSEVEAGVLPIEEYRRKWHGGV
jgi:hypothetical protein